MKHLDGDCSGMKQNTVTKQMFSRPEWMAGVIRERILNGQYKPGERLREIQLREEFGFSNGPTREALQLLVAEGLLHRSPWQGVKVIELAKEEIVDLFQVRLALLEYAAELAATRRNDSVLKEAPKVKKELKKTFALARRGEITNLNGQLMDWLFRAGGNKRLEQLWNRTMLQCRIYVYQSIRKSARSEPPTFALVDAVVAGNVKKARQSARDLTRHTLFELLGEEL
jgi:DNA-binding GntR family transcriptional regulator